MGYKTWMHFKNDPPATNALVFATQEEAVAAGDELMSRWFVPIGFEVRETNDPVNYTIVDGRPSRIISDPVENPPEKSPA